MAVEGNPPPPAVLGASAAYRTSQDVIGRFAAEVLRFGSGQATSAAIKVALERWAEEQGLEIPDFQLVTDALKAAGCTSSRQTIAGHKITAWCPVAIDGAVKEQNGGPE